ncbi:MAG: DUF4178 domain-containing protein [Micromonosporaceae bacterium]
MVVAGALLLAILAVLIAILVIVLVARRKARQQQERAASRPRPQDPFAADANALRGDPRRLKPGDIVDIRAQTHAVRGSLHFTEGSWGWAEHLLDDLDGRKRWLSVEEDPDLELVLWIEVAGATVAPGPKSLDFDGRSYALDESGSARYTGTGTTGLHPEGTVRYYDYRAADGARLSFEEYGGSGTWELARGEELGRHELQVFSNTDNTPDQA